MTSRKAQLIQLATMYCLASNFFVLLSFAAKTYDQASNMGFFAGMSWIIANLLDNRARKIK